MEIVVALPQSAVQAGTADRLRGAIVKYCDAHLNSVTRDSGATTHAAGSCSRSRDFRLDRRVPRTIRDRSSVRVEGLTDDEP